MTAQPSQETVKPEALVDIIEELANTPMQLPMGRWDEISNTLILASRALAATQKLEAEKAELQRENVMLREIIGSTFGVLHGSPAIKGTENEASVIAAQRSATYITQLRSQLDGMTKAEAELKRLLSEATLAGDPGDEQCTVRERRKYNYELDKWQKRVDAALTTQPQPAAGMEGEQS